MHPTHADITQLAIQLSRLGGLLTARTKLEELLAANGAAKVSDLRDHNRIHVYRGLLQALDKVTRG